MHGPPMLCRCASLCQCLFFTFFFSRGSLSLPTQLIWRFKNTLPLSNVFVFPDFYPTFFSNFPPWPFGFAFFASPFFFFSLKPPPTLSPARSFFFPRLIPLSFAGNYVPLSLSSPLFPTYGLTSRATNVASIEKPVSFSHPPIYERRT